jgi:hypothetical protein
MKIMRDGFVFECESQDEAKAIVNMFKFGGPAKVAASDEAKVKRATPKGYAKKSWTEEEVRIIMRLYTDGVNVKEICRTPSLDRHTRGAIYNKVWCIRHKRMKNLGMNFASMAAKLGYPIA